MAAEMVLRPVTIEGNTMTKVNLIPQNELEAEINKLGKSFTTLQSRTHTVACSVLAVVIETSDVRMVTKFLDALPIMARVNTIREWFEVFGPVAFDKKGVCFTPRVCDIEAAMATPFFKMAKPEEAYKPMNTEKTVNRLIAQLEKDAKETARDHNALLMILKTIPAEALAQA